MNLLYPLKSLLLLLLLGVTPTKGESSSSRKKTKSSDEPAFEVIIGGAGAAGIAVAHTLKELGDVDNFALIEGKDDIGGRIRSIRFGSGEKKYTVETGANYISGGEKNPFLCQMEKLDKRLNGFDPWWTFRINNVKGKQILGDWEDDWVDKDGEVAQNPKNMAQRMVRASEEADWYAKKCLMAKVGTKVSKWCNNLCKFNKTKMKKGGTGIMDLVETDENICNKKGGVFVPKKNLDMSVTDIFRVGGFYPPTDPDRTCNARALEYIWHDIEIAHEPWDTSAKNWLNDPTFGGDFGKERDFLIFDKRGYVYLLKEKAAEVLETSKKTGKEIVLDDDRIMLNKKITHVYWDPDGKKDVKVTYCDTEKENEYSYPCADAQRYNVTAKNFVSTFSVGVLKKSLELERNPIKVSDDVSPMFHPQLSSMKELETMLDGSTMGSLLKVIMQFKDKFWEDKEGFVTPFSKDGFQCDYAPVWFSLDSKKGHEGSNTLALFVTGERAKLLSKNKSRQDVLEQFLPVLNKHFKKGIRKYLAEEGEGRKKLGGKDVMDIFVPDWYNDPQTRGCWQVTPAGTSYAANDGELKPFRYGNLQFSGEGTCERMSGWVHGGWFSGEQSAKILLKERLGHDSLDTRTLCQVSRKEMDFKKAECKWVPKTKKEDRKSVV